MGYDEVQRNFSRKADMKDYAPARMFLPGAGRGQCLRARCRLRSYPTASDVLRILSGRAVSPDAEEAGALERVVICGKTVIDHTVNTTACVL